RAHRGGDRESRLLDGRRVRAARRPGHRRRPAYPIRRRLPGELHDPASGNLGAESHIQRAGDPERGPVGQRQRGVTQQRGRHHRHRLGWRRAHLWHERPQHRGLRIRLPDGWRPPRRRYGARKRGVRPRCVHGTDGCALAGRLHCPEPLLRQRHLPGDGTARRVACDLREYQLVYRKPSGHVAAAGGPLSGQSVTVPRVNGVPWRVITPLSVGGGGTLTFARGDTVTFDSTAAIIVGDTLTGSGSLHAIAPDTAPILLETTPGLPYWHGITYLNAVGDTSLRNVTVAGAGYFLPCPLIDCLGTTIGAIRVVGTLASNLVFDSITVRNVGFYALQALQSGSPVVVTHGQFYQNVGPTLFQASGPALQIDSSDIYHYRISGAPALVNTDGTSDSIVAKNNWWGDVSGPGLIQFGSADSLGRTLLDTAQSGVAYLPFATGPH